MPDLPEFVNALGAKNWYAAGALVLGAAVWTWRRFGRRYWEKIPRGYRWLPPLLVAAASGFTAAFYAGADAKSAGLAALAAVWGVALPAMGGHGVLKELARRGEKAAKEAPGASEE